MQAIRGFSLVELSIVLVILGLLTGGILAGQSLIRASELRAVSTEYNRYLTATHAFRDKYFGLPGDLGNANSFWPAAANGNRDGILDVSLAASTAGEAWGYWQQMALAGLIEGSYSGASGAGGAYEGVIGSNVPISKLGMSGWTAYPAGTRLVGDTFYFEGDYGNIFVFGGAVAGFETYAANLVPSETWNIDTKLDDGKPSTGKMRVFESQGGSTAGARCFNAASSASALVGTVDYDLAANGKYCSVIFLLQ